MTSDYDHHPLMIEAIKKAAERGFDKDTIVRVTGARYETVDKYYQQVKGKEAPKKLNKTLEKILKN